MQEHLPDGPPWSVDAALKAARTCQASVGIFVLVTFILPHLKKPRDRELLVTSSADLLLDLSKLSPLRAGLRQKAIRYYSEALNAQRRIKGVNVSIQLCCALMIPNSSLMGVFSEVMMLGGDASLHARLLNPVSGESVASVQKKRVPVSRIREALRLEINRANQVAWGPGSFDRWDRINSSRLLFMFVSDMSELVCVAAIIYAFYRGDIRGGLPVISSLVLTASLARFVSKRQGVRQAKKHFFEVISLQPFVPPSRPLDLVYPQLKVQKPEHAHRATRTNNVDPLGGTKPCNEQKEQSDASAGPKKEKSKGPRVGSEAPVLDRRGPSIQEAVTFDTLAPLDSIVFWCSGGKPTTITNISLGVLYVFMLPAHEGRGRDQIVLTICDEHLEPAMSGLFPKGLSVGDENTTLPMKLHQKLATAGRVGSRHDFLTWVRPHDPVRGGQGGAFLKMRNPRSALRVLFQGTHLKNVFEYSGLSDHGGKQKHSGAKCRSTSVNLTGSKELSLDKQGSGMAP